MLDKKYAIVSNGSVIFTLELNENTTKKPERIQDFVEGFSKPFFIKDITNTSKVKIGATWNGTSFSESDTVVSPVKLRRAALVADNVIFGIIFLSTQKDSEIIKEAEEKGVIAVDITDRDDSLLIKEGSIWDGTNFIN